MRTDDERPGRRSRRVPWYRNSNWLLVAVVVVVGIWLFRVFSQNVAPLAVEPKAVPAASASQATPAAARVFRKPVAPARVVQYAHATGERGKAKPTDLTGTLARAPQVGDVLLAFASTGFGCIVAPGWTALGDGAGSVGIAYRIAQAGDGKEMVPFTTSRASTYTLEVIEVSGGPDIVASPRSGGSYVLASSIPTTISLAIPQTGGMLFRLYAASGYASDRSAPLGFASTLPAGQQQSIVDRIPSYGWGAELIVLATTTDPKNAAQPFSATETATFAAHRAPGNTMAGWFVWVGGPLGARP